MLVLCFGGQQNIAAANLLFEATSKIPVDAFQTHVAKETHIFQVGVLRPIVVRIHIFIQWRCRFFQSIPGGFPKSIETMKSSAEQA